MSRTGVERSLKNLKGCTVYEGHARFSGPHSVEVGDETLRADWIFINVGGRALIPPIPGLDEVGYLTNSSMMDVDFLPPHLIVLGGSYIGLEFAQIYRRFGSEVSVIELAPRLIAREDEDVSTAVADILSGEGIKTYVNSSVVGVARTATHCRRGRQRGNGLAGHRIAFAPGRRAAAEHRRSRIWKLPASRSTSAASSRLTTSCEPTCPGSGPWATATVGARSRTHPTTTLRSSQPTFSTTVNSGGYRDRIPAYALYTDPPLGRVGMTEAEVRQAGHAAMVGTIADEATSAAPLKKARRWGS